MTDQVIKPASEHFDVADAERRIKAIFIGSIGNLVEWYDFYAYTAFALYFAPAFFPGNDPVVQQLNVAVVFAATFLMRPLGGWFFGYLADHFGRRISLTLSVVFMCFGSLIIAVTPTYATIGFAAPAILALARVIEGLSLGGEYGASATYLSEVADPKHRGFYSSFQYVTLIGGQLTAIIVLLLLQKVFLTPDELKAWGWRIPFAIGAALAIFAAVMRRNLHETEAFEEAKKVVKPTGSITNLLRYPRELLLVVGLTAGGTAAFYTFTTYMQTFVKLSVGLTEDQTTFVIFGTLIFATILQPIYGAISDKIGRKPLLIFFGVAGSAGDRAAADDTEGDEVALHGLHPDLLCLAVRRRLHLDQRRGEGRAVPDQCPRARRRPALCDHGLDFRRHGTRDRALLQEHRARGMVLLLPQRRHLPVADHLFHHARHQARLRNASPRVS
ncbi:MHS family alpha-ketoglutarate permease-like MFS transporter [Bradyrhizobium diazoefficiens]